MAELLEIPNFDQLKVIVYGDLMLDRYWYGDTKRISPEAPVPIVGINNVATRPGGAANVALNLAALGAKANLFGLVGKDKEAIELHHQLNELGIDCLFKHLDHYPTTTKLRVLGQSQQLLRLDFERPLNSIIDDNDLRQQYTHHLNDADVVVLSDYAKGALQHSAKLIELAQQRGIPVLVDPKSLDFCCYRGASLITPNLKEFEAVVGPSQHDEEIIAKAHRLIDEHNIGAILVTRGKNGMLLIEKDNTTNFSARERDVYDVTGAGDTVIAVMAACIAAGLTFSQAANLANMAAGLVVRKLGAESVSAPELRRELNKSTNSHVGALSESELLLAVADARAHGETVVMTNGCFDILHAGHIQCLQQAKKLGSRLIVAVNDDNSVKRLKGETRPVNSLLSRMEVLAALRPVDWVVAFSEDTPQRLIEAVLPDILVKGADYTPSNIAGGDAVIANGGQVKILPILDGYSTTQVVNKIKGALTG